MMTDPISDMLSRIRNASMVHGRDVVVPHSRMKYEIASILHAEGFLAGVEEYQDGNRPMLRLRLKYDEQKKPAIQKIQRISKPSRRVYVKANDISQVCYGFGRAILSTPSGLMTNREAKKRRLGGEVICEIF
ncbi:MAG: 30S ribosomal protein S8 [Patescibacteria group bacterium]|jgi:small subunit ribosomal protein S8